MSAIGNFFRGLFGGGSTSVQQTGRASADTSGVTDKMLNDLALAEAIYADKPPWLNEDNPPLIPTGVGPLIAAEIATMVTIEAKISVDNDPVVDGIIQNFIMPRLREETEKGWALGGLVFKPYYNKASFEFDSDNNLVGVNGNLKVAFIYPDSFIVDDFDTGGQILKARFFATQTKDGRYYTKVEKQDYNEATRELVITNDVYESAGPPTKYKWDNLGAVKMPLNTIDKWADIPPRMAFTNVDGCLIGMYRPANANNADFTSPYGRSPLVRAANVLRRIDRAFNGVDWELDSSLARVFIDERAVAIADNVPKKVSKSFVKIVGDSEGKTFFEKFSPDIRDEAYLKIINGYLRQAEDIVGLARGTISEAQEGARTATEISKTRQKTYAKVVDNQKALETALRQLAAACQVWLYPADVKGKPEMTFDFDDSIVSNPTEQLALYMMLQNAGNIPAWKTNMMYFNVSKLEAIELWRQGRAEASEVADYNDMGEFVEIPGGINVVTL
jgi:A118 family predicted phage portal protein